MHRVVPHRLRHPYLDNELKFPWWNVSSRPPHAKMLKRSRLNELQMPRRTRSECEPVRPSASMASRCTWRAAWRRNTRNRNAHGRASTTISASYPKLAAAPDHPRTCGLRRQINPPRAVGLAIWAGYMGWLYRLLDLCLAIVCGFDASATGRLGGRRMQTAGYCGMRDLCKIRRL